MSSWMVDIIGKKPALKDPILIEGLPGVGNVGKVAVDFIIEELKAKKLYDIFSYTLPHSVFVNEKNLVELPKIEMFYIKGKKQDLLILGGDVQPMDEVSSYEFCEKILDICKEHKVKEIITLGGIGLQQIPKKPRVFCTGNNREIIKRYMKGTSLNNQIYGVVGPIVGASGLLLGLGTKRKISGIAMLAETFGHPMYLGVKGAREIIKILTAKLGLKIRLSQLDNEIADIEGEILKKTSELGDVSRKTAIKKLKGKIGKEVSYIG